MPDLVCRDVRTRTISVWWIVSGHHHNSTVGGLLVKYQCVAVMRRLLSAVSCCINYRHSWPNYA